MKYGFSGFLLAFGLFLSLSGCISAQNVLTRKELSGKLEKQYDKAAGFNRQGDFASALKELDALIEKAPNLIDAYLMRGAIHFTGQHYAAAKADYDKAISLNEKHDPFVWYQLGLACHKLMDFETAIVAFERYIASNPGKPELRNRAVRHLENARFAAEAVKNPKPFHPSPLGDAINSPESEYLPALSADGAFIVFTRRVSGQEDFYFSRKTDAGWAPAAAAEQLNTPLNEGAHAISADGRILVFTACDSRAGFGGCDIFYAVRDGDTWTTPERLGPTVNTPAWEGQPSLSADGRALYFASERKGGFGGRDIWVSYLGADNRWGQPVNLGDSINTPGNDECPFIHPDGQTLYFCSDGRPGMGEDDLFIARRQGKTWTRAQNLGYPLNTPADDGTLSVSLDGQTGYFARETGLAGTKFDIFSFPLFQEARPQPVTFVLGNVKDLTNGEPVEAAVTLSDPESGETLSALRSDPAGGFLVCLPAGRNYALHVEAEGFLFFSEHFELKELNPADNPFLLEVKLSPALAAGNENTAPPPVVLRNVFFDTGSADLQPESKEELQRLKDLLDKNPGIRIRINGHTDNAGNDLQNQTLSENRAKAVYDWLIAQGISDKRLRFQGFGESQPIDTNDTPEGRRRNRRTEFEILPTTDH